MTHVVLYTKSYCPFSKECKEMLTEKGIDFDEIIIDEDPLVQKEMESKSGGRTDTPQVFINGQHIGSGDDLKTMESTGELSKVLNV